MIQPGSIIETTIDKIGTQGDGIGRLGDSLVIVPKTAAGDKVSCKVKYTAGGRIHSDLLEVTQGGSGRIPAPCVYYESCGGCGLQHINAGTYKNYKLDLLISALKYNNVPMPENISWLGVGEKSRRRAFIRLDASGKLGFYEHQSHKVVDIETCLILDSAIEALLARLKAISRKLGINIEGWMVTNTDSGIDLILHSEDKKSKDESVIIEALKHFSQENNLARIAWKCGKNITPIITIKTPALDIGGLEIELTDEYFLQASKAGQKALLDSVVANVSTNSNVLDLYSGVGVYSFALAGKVRQVSAYEISVIMINSMNQNIKKHRMENIISANCRNIDQNPLSNKELAAFDTAIINPPRTGALKQVTTIAGARIKKVIMVSCNSQTFARDAKVLQEAGYSLISLDAIDQFTYSHHLEQVGVFTLLA